MEPHSLCKVNAARETQGGNPSPAALHCRLEGELHHVDAPSSPPSHYCALCSLPTASHGAAPPGAAPCSRPLGRTVLRRGPHPLLPLCRTAPRGPHPLLPLCLTAPRGPHPLRPLCHTAPRGPHPLRPLPLLPGEPRPRNQFNPRTGEDGAARFRVSCLGAVMRKPSVSIGANARVTQQ